ncbi:MAG: DUF4325 domain-containing protein [Nitrospinaceae bacterium]|nr:STAS-like domain-containing protein [Nitrospinaceae bacterium]NIR55812.1 STAS-like domain-containing protein [Nitrospinaceae bacterium]NIS86265.1 STAS-like domain-containing protein [Nitrospinaceae bacterium]NIT83094.1 STAS-like domain-containing protein [Nitrospinaceae bacterium]NIU45304.1 STAS-like domain-containing protein [Nitrospinaceae bacterium]
MESELIIDVYKFIGEDILFGRHSEDGSPSAESLRNHILENWDKYERISIQVDSVVQMTRPFLDEAFAKLLEHHSLEDFNQKIYFPDAKEKVVQDLNNAFKVRLKIIQANQERDQDELGL